MASQHSPASGVAGNDNADIARDLWIAASESNVEEIRRLLAPDVEWRVFSSGSLSGSLCGVNAVIDLLARTGELVDTFTSDLIDIYASEDGAVTHYRVHAERGGRTLDSEAMLLMRMRSGRIIEAYAVPMNAQADDSFWLSH